MDLSHYIKRSKNARGNPGPERRCLKCGTVLENQGEPLYYKGFCCAECREEYIGRKIED